MTDERLAQPRVFTYDSINRLTASTGGPSGPITYGLDGVGNRTTVTGGPDPGTYTMDPLLPEPADRQMNQYTTTPFDGDPAVQRTHDKNGNVTLLPFEDDDLSTTVMATATYDYRNLMVKYERPGLTAEYRYDALGRRIGKTVTDDTGSTPTVATTHYLYRGDQVVEERDGTGGLAPAAAPVAATYVYGNGIDEVLNMRRVLDGGAGPAEADFFYHADDQGTVWAVTDGAGAVVERYDYEDYGETKVLSPAGGTRIESSMGNVHSYTGRRIDAESGLYWYRTRYYDSASGRFLSPDSIGIWGDIRNIGNGLTYVATNPWLFIDPYGLLSSRDSSPYFHEPDGIVYDPYSGTDPDVNFRKLPGGTGAGHRDYWDMVDKHGMPARRAISKYWGNFSAVGIDISCHINCEGKLECCVGISMTLIGGSIG